MSENELTLWRGRNLGVIYQSFQLLPMLTLVQNVIMPMDLSGLYHPRKSRERALELLEMVELTEHVDKYPSQISGGQQQRVAIARALANDPPLLVADEPTGSLDSVTADHIFNLFQQLIGDNRTIIMVTHDQGLLPRFSRYIQIADGQLVGRGERVMKIQPGSHPGGQNQGLIQMLDVVKTYQTTAGDFTALRGVDLTAEKG